MEIKEAEIYKKRLEKEYGELLSYRTMILGQIDIEEKQLRGLREQKYRLGEEILLKLEEERSGLKEAKRARAGFLAGLIEQEKKIEKEKREIAEREEELKSLLGVCEATKISQSRELEEIEREKAGLEEKNKLTERKDKEISEKLLKLEGAVNENADEKQYAEDKLKELVAKDKEIKGKEIELEVSKELLKRDREQLLLREKRLNEERAHLESQQQDLKLAFEEARRRNLL